MDSEDEQLEDFTCTSDGTKYFDNVIGHIEDIVLSKDFELLHTKFLDSNWKLFENTEENKLEYMDVFNNYTSIFEAYFTRELKERMEHFEMTLFAQQLDAYNANCPVFDRGEILELFNSFLDFSTFKELMLDYRNSKENDLQHLQADILVTKVVNPILLEPTFEHQAAEQPFSDMK